MKNADDSMPDATDEVLGEITKRGRPASEKQHKGRKKGTKNKKPTIESKRIAAGGYMKTVTKAALADSVILPERISIPVIPSIDITHDRVLHEEQQMARVEMLMLKGVNDTRLLMSMLQLDDRKKVDRWIERIHVRWAAMGGAAKLKRHRGSALTKLSLVQNELWAMASEVKTTDNRAFIACMQQVREVVRFETELHGITPSVIERLNLAEDGANPAMLAMQKNEALVSMFKKFMAVAGIVANTSEKDTHEILHGDADKPLT